MTRPKPKKREPTDADVAAMRANMEAWLQRQHATAVQAHRRAGTRPTPKSLNDIRPDDFLRALLNLSPEDAAEVRAIADTRATL